MADDVLQHGKSGHCWFLSTIASLAERFPDYIRSLIVDKGGGRYGPHPSYTKRHLYL